MESTVSCADQNVALAIFEKGSHDVTGEPVPCCDVLDHRTLKPLQQPRSPQTLSHCGQPENASPVAQNFHAVSARYCCRVNSRSFSVSHSLETCDTRSGPYHAATIFCEGE